MNFNNLDFIRFILDTLIAVICLVLVARLWHQHNRPNENSPSAPSPETLPVTASDRQVRHFPPPLGGAALDAQKNEVKRLIQSGRSLTEIARQTGLSRGEVELIQKFTDKT